MTVLIDLRPNNKTGIYRYGIEVASRLIAMKGFNYLIYCPICVMDELKAKSNVTIPDENYIIAEKYALTRNSKLLRDEIKKRSVDVVYSINYILEENIGIPFIITIHDLIRFKAPKNCFSDNQITGIYGQNELNKMKDELMKKNIEIGKNTLSSWLDYKMYELAHKSEKIITVSESSKKDIEHHINICPSKIKVSFCGLSRDFQTLNTNILRKENLFLYVGTSKPHKNLDWILYRWKEVLEKNGMNIKLVLVCSGSEMNSGILPLIETLGIGKSICLKTGISDRELAILYQSSNSLLIASSKEGFCLPALEAISCGCNVICCEIPVIKEILGAEACLENFSNPKDFESSILKAIRGIRKNCNPRIRIKYDWTSVTSRIWETLNEALEKSKRNHK